VGYRQVWQYLAGELGLSQLRETGVAATRQLAKRQLTWLRGEHGYECLDPTADSGTTSILAAVQRAGFVAAPVREC